MRHAAIILYVGLLATPASATETVIHEEIMGQGGLLCDTQDEVKAYIELVEAGEHPQEAASAIAGCGFLQQPVVMRVIAVGKYGQRDKEYLLVRYEFKGVPIPNQFGVGAVKNITRS